MHLSEEQIQRLLHGELAAAPATAVREHLVSCAECRDRVDQAQGEEQWVFGQLGALDHPLPSVQATDIIRSSQTVSVTRRARWAAGLFLALAGAGAAYAAPGSPLPGVLARLIGSAETRSEQATPDDQPDRAEAQAGIAVVPGDRLTVSFRTAAPGDTAVVLLNDGREVVIQVRGGQTSFTSEPQRVVIGQEGPPARFEIRIPRSASRVEVEMAGRRLLLAQASRVTADVSPDSSGRYILPLLPSR